MRNLASVQTVKRVDAIPGKDRIGYVSFNKVEWRVIGEKNLTPGQKVVYVEYDSILPVHPAFEFLRKRCYSEKQQGFKIGCMRMGGLVSYGLLLTYESVKDFIPRADWDSYEEGSDLTGILKVRKFEDEVPVIRMKKGFFRRVLDAVFGEKKLPAGFIPFVQKSDETRAETLPYLFDEKWRGKKVYVTVKVDGQSGTFALNKGMFYAASRNQILYAEKEAKAARELRPAREGHYQKYGQIFLQMAAKYDAVKKLKAYGSGIAVQFEQAGPKIQKNHLGLGSLQIFVFNVYDVERGRYLGWDALESFCVQSGFPTVPFVEKRVFDWNNMDELYEYSKGTYANGHVREGVVIRSDSGGYMDSPEIDMHAMWSFKVINPDYLLGSQ
ncbi:MAG: hypothetical protein LBN92_04825 [Treponema sp.]|jgi:RNA ligase (TIGR02306 family)|nr:hypothetical protein [Treponema sp.]